MVTSCINLEKNAGRNDFKKIIFRYKRTGYNMNVIRQTVCFDVNPTTVDNFAALLNCAPADRALDLMAPA